MGVGLEHFLFLCFVVYHRIRKGDKQVAGGPSRMAAVRLAGVGWGVCFLFSPKDMEEALLSSCSAVDGKLCIFPGDQ